MSQIRGRFKKAADKKVDQYTASIPYDWRLYPYDIAGSIAHARMLARQGIITGKEADAIIAGLNGIKEEIEEGQFLFRSELEDIHMHIEARLIELNCPTGHRFRQPLSKRAPFRASVTVCGLGQSRQWYCTSMAMRRKFFRSRRPR